MLKSQSRTSTIGWAGIALLAAVASAALRPDDVPRVMLGLAAAVVVPLAVPLVEADLDVRRAARLAGFLVPLALILPAGATAALLALPWLGVSAWIARRTLQVWWREPELHAGALTRLASVGYLVAGSGWAVVDRLGVTPLGFGPVVVLLTAVHFHYAGFAASLLTSLLDRERPVPIGIAACVAFGPAMVAAGFVFRRELQSVGAVFITIGLVTVAARSMRAGALPRGAPAAARAWTTVSGICVVGGMSLALVWTLGSVIGLPGLAIATMARTHGLLNGIGFSLCGIVGRRLA